MSTGGCIIRELAKVLFINAPCTPNASKIFASSKLMQPKWSFWTWYPWTRTCRSVKSTWWCSWYCSVFVGRRGSVYATPGQILKDLNKKFLNCPLPTPQLLCNRKAYITKRFGGGWEIETQRVMDEWVDAFRIESKEAYDCVEDRWCRPIVLGTVEGEGINHADTLV